MQTPTLRHLFLLLASGWAILIYYLSSQPGTDVPALFFGQDKVFHFIAFGVLGFLGMGAIKTSGHAYKPGQAWLAVVLVTAYGVLDEVHQYFVPGCTADHYDVIADMLGGMFGVWLMYYLLKMLSARSSEFPHSRE